MHDAVELAVEIARLRRIEAAAREYLTECDCPAPDYTLRRQLRERLKEELADE